MGGKIILIIAHRINALSNLQAVPKELGVEIDVRFDNRTGKLYLHHDPQSAGRGLEECSNLEEYLQHFQHAFVVFNIKEAGTEKQVIELAAKSGLHPDQYFLLDVEFPFLYAATRGTRADKLTTNSIAVRYSEAEPIEMALAQKGLVNWAWIDSNTKLPLDQTSAPLLMDNFKTCLVSPDRWRPDQAKTEIPAYRQKMTDLGFRLDAVMVGLEHVDLWR
jgi:hypothetical protein